MEQTKTLVSSWTFWFGALQIALAVVGFLSGQMDQGAALTLATTGATTIGLRLKTSQPLSATLSK